MTVLSAYYDQRPTIDPVGPPWVDQRTPRVRVLAIVKYKKENLVKKSARDMKPKTFAAGTFPIMCRLVWKEEDGELLEELTELEVVVLEEGGEEYVGTFISCFPNDNREKGKPTEVVLATPEREVRLQVEEILAGSPIDQLMIIIIIIIAIVITTIIIIIIIIIISVITSIITR